MSRLMASPPAAAGDAEIVNAVKEGDVDRVASMLNSDPHLLYARSERGESLPLLAAYYGSFEIGELFLQRGIILDIFEASALGCSAQVSTLLMREPALVGSYSSDGWSPLHLASYFGHGAVVPLLLAHGAEIDLLSANPPAQTPLQSAISALEIEMAALLLKSGADPNRRAAGGWTALHMAVHEGSEELVDLLLKAGAALNAPRSDGATPFMTALLAGHRKIVRLLHAHGATRWA